jgi:hypothetical protein
MSSNSNFDDDYDDDYQGSTSFAKLQKMQRFLHVNDDFIDRFDGYELSWP